MFMQQRKKRLRLHSFGPIWTISTGNQWEICEVGRLSCFIEFFVCFHIVCGRYTTYFRLISLFWHFSDHFHPTLEQKRAIDLRPCRIKLSYKCFEKNRAKWDMFKDVGGARYFLYLKYIWNMRCLMKRLNGSSSVIQGDIWYLKAISFTLGLQT